jgi:hypothetical protein
MAQKFLYIVNHYVPYPDSNGGLWNVVAEDDNECFDLIVAEDANNFYESYYNQLKENILNGIVYELAGEVESCIVESFLD